MQPRRLETRGKFKSAFKVGPLWTNRLFDRMPAEVDLRDEAQAEAILSTADELLARVNSLYALDEIECLLGAQPEDWPLGAHVAVKLARSKALLAAHTSTLHLSVVVPVYREHLRILSPGEHCLGEGFVDRKLRELEWLMSSSASRRFEMLLIDDGCPEGSGQLCEEVLATRHPDAPARVVYLAEAIDQRCPVVERLQSTDESQKGGAIQLGLWEATRQSYTGHVVLYTDADLSTNLGQSGLLVSALRSTRIAIAAGTRRAQNSVAVKSSARSMRGRLFIYLWKNILSELSHLDDTQCGFKAMRAGVARAMVNAPTERGFAFDLEMLLRCEIESPRSTTAVPIAWIDSQSASTTDSLSPYLPMLQSVVRLYRAHSNGSRIPDAFARAIEQLDEAAWQRAIELFGPRFEGIDSALDCVVMPMLPAELMMDSA